MSGRCLGEAGLSQRSRNRMRRTFAALPWEMLGPRMVMITLTLPSDWRRYTPDGRASERQRRLFVDRFEYRWGPMVGVWVKEFQKRGAPHLHFWVGLPDSVAEGDYEGLRARSELRRRIAREAGTARARAAVGRIGGRYGGDFGDWLRLKWAEIVTGNTDGSHFNRGVDVEPCFWTEDAIGKADLGVVQEYFWRESVKKAQKAPPQGYGAVGRYWGVIGQRQGFRPEALRVVELDQDRAAVAELVLARVARSRLGGVDHCWLDERRLGDGLTVFVPNAAQLFGLVMAEVDAPSPEYLRSPV